MRDKTKALQKLLNGTATKKEIELLKQALASGEISIGGDVKHSIVVTGDGNNISLTQEALNLLKPEITNEEPAAGDPPYKGLRYFDTSDADLFYGRQALTLELLARVQKESFFSIIGASGSGKSSVARAGLIPAWMKENAGRSVVHVITPTAHPLESLAASLTRESESVRATATLMDDLKNDSRSLRLYVKKTLGGTKLLLLADQFEETFTLCKDADERKAFVENLLSLADEDSSARVVITLRADFYHHCAEYEGLRQALKKHQEYIGAMTVDELRQAITTPAENNGWDFQPGLVDLILQDVGTEPGALPLLSHALLETWKRRQGRMLTLKGYADAGGVKKAIAQTAESVYDKLSPAEQTIARGIFLRLTELGEGTQDTRRRVKMDELAQSKKQDSAAKVLKTLTDARLVTTEQDSAEVAHEALIREWGTLRNWLDEDRESLRLHRHLTESAQEWERSDRNDLYLIHRGGRLDDVLSLRKNSIFKLSTIEQTYLNACLSLKIREQRERERRLRYSVIASTVAAITFLILGSFGLVKSNEATSQAATAQSNADIALARQLAAQAKITYEQTGKGTLISALLAIESLRHSPSIEANQALLQSLSILPRPIVIMSKKYYGPISSGYFNSDGNLAIVGSWDGSADVLDTASGKVVSQMRHLDWVTVAKFSSDDSFAASGSHDHTVSVWETISGQKVVDFDFGASVSDLAISPDNKLIAAVGNSMQIRVWDLNTGQECMIMNHDSVVNSISFSPDGNFLLSASEDKTVRLWDVRTGNELFKMQHDDVVQTASFNPNGDWIVSASKDNTARVWSTDSGKELIQLHHSSWVSTAIFSPDGKWVATGSYDRTVRIWDPLSGEEITRISHEGEARALAFSPNGKLVVTGSQESVRIWDVLTGEEIARIVTDNWSGVATFSSDGKKLLIDSSSTLETNQERVLLFDVTDMNKVIKIVHNGEVTSASFNSNGQLIITGSADKSARVSSVSNGNLISQKKHDGTVMSVSFSPRNNLVASGSWGDRSIFVWDPVTGKTKLHLDGGANALIFNSDGTLLAASTATGRLKVFDASNGTDLFKMEVPSGYTSATSFTSNDKFVGFGNDTSCSIWDAKSGKLVTIIQNLYNVLSLDFSPDGTQIVCASWDKTARVFDVNTGNEISRMTHAAEVNAVAFSPNGLWIVSGSEDHTARVWNAATGEEISRMTHEGSVTSVAFSPDSKWVVSGGGYQDNTARVWAVSNGQEISRMTHDDSVNVVSFSPNDKLVMSGSDDHTVRIWMWNSKDLITETCSRLLRNLTRAEWNQYIGDALPYQASCPNLPIEPEPTPTP